jgi:hypothetical protein
MLCDCVISHTAVSHLPHFLKVTSEANILSSCATQRIRHARLDFCISLSDQRFEKASTMREIAQFLSKEALRFLTDAVRTGYSTQG